MTLKTGGMMMKNQLKSKLYFTIYINRKYFIIIIFHNIDAFIEFLIK